MDNGIVRVALFGWVPLVAVIFLLCPPRRAIIVSFLAGWLFLPIVGYRIPGFLVYSKGTIVPLSVLLGLLVFDPLPIFKFRPRWFDLPMLVWCVVPFFSSLSNDLGPYDGLSATTLQVLTWGIAYFIGRAYFTGYQELRDLAVGIFAGGLIYVPLCLFEIKMAPRLHLMVYGVHQDGYTSTLRFGGWRPTVFMEHGLMVGMWMCMSALIGVWLWRSGWLKRMWGVPVAWLAVPLLITAVLCKSTGALILMVVGFLALQLGARLRTAAPILILCILPLMYIGLRSTGTLTGDALLAGAQLFGQDRADSLHTRLVNENEMAERALLRPVVGWGKWGRARIHNSSGKDVSITDGLWIIAMGDHGLVGVASVTLFYLVPGFMLCRGTPAREWLRGPNALPAVMATVSLLCMLDNLANAMINPLFTLSTAATMTALATRRAAVASMAARRVAAPEPRHQRGRGGGGAAPAQGGPSAIVPPSR